MIPTIVQDSVNIEALQLTPARLSLPVPVHPCIARSLMKNVVFHQAASSCYVSHTIERAARGTDSDRPAHS